MNDPDPRDDGAPPGQAPEDRAAIERVVAAAEARQIELIRFLWVDHNGILRGKAVTRRFLAERMVSGIGLARVRQAADLSDRPVAVPLPGFGAVGEVRLRPDPATYVELPHAPGSAAMLCDLREPAGGAWDACPRAFLADAVELAAGAGFEVRAAFEPEFTLASAGTAPGEASLADDSLCFDNAGFDRVHGFTVELVRALAAAGLAPEVYHPEFGPGQHELTLRHAAGVRAADEHVWQRAITRGLAARAGWTATFAPMPYPGARGNGDHVHVSLWRGGENAFADPAGGLTPTARHFIGGVLEHAEALTALTCASVNSYQRLKPEMWAGAYACWGHDNREAAVRVPSALRGRACGSVNVEFKPCDATANPYLALGAILHAGLDGVARRCDPGDPLADEPHRLSDARRRELGVRRLPASLGEALDALHRDPLLLDALGPLRRVLYPAIKRADVAALAGRSDGEVCALHARRY